MKSDAQIQKDVMDQLKSEPFLNAAEIGVAVKNGIVTLSGRVDSFSKKMTAERATKKVMGVKAIAEDIQIDVFPHDRTDAEIAESVLRALRWHSGVQEEKVKIRVENGVVKLEGEVEWNFQRSNARMAIEHIDGVRSVINLIEVKPAVKPTDIQQKISNAFHRHATLDAKNITVEVNGSRITLRGTVRSFAEKEDADYAAWTAPGVTIVDNRLELKIPGYGSID